MNDIDRHRRVSTRLAAWRAGLLSDAVSAEVAEHLDTCESCRALAEAYAAPAEADLAPAAKGEGEHLPAGLLAAWPRVRRELSGLERVLARRHLERCSECRQDLEMLGHAPVLEHDPALEPAPSLAAAAGVSATAAVANATAGSLEAVGAAHGSGADETMRVIRIVRSRPRWWDRALITWSSLATATAAIAIVTHLARPVVEPPPMALAPPSSASAPRDAGERAGGISLAFAPRPRSLNGPVKDPENEGGKMNVIPVVGPVRSLALAVRPLSIPDTSLVMISLLDAEGDTLFAVRHRQWEFFPKRVLMIDGAEEPLPPGQYALVLASLITQRGTPTPLMSRYRFELRPR